MTGPDYPEGHDFHTQRANHDVASRDFTELVANMPDVLPVTGHEWVVLGREGGALRGVKDRALSLVCPHCGALEAGQGPQGVCPVRQTQNTFGLPKGETG